MKKLRLVLGVTVAAAPVAAHKTTANAAIHAVDFFIVSPPCLGFSLLFRGPPKLENIRDGEIGLLKIHKLYSVQLYIIL